MKKIILLLVILMAIGVAQNTTKVDTVMVKAKLVELAERHAKAVENIAMWEKERDAIIYTYREFEALLPKQEEVEGK